MRKRLRRAVEEMWCVQARGEVRSRRGRDRRRRGRLRRVGRRVLDQRRQGCRTGARPHVAGHHQVRLLGRQRARHEAHLRRVPGGAPQHQGRLRGDPGRGGQPQADRPDRRRQPARRGLHRRRHDGRLRLARRAREPRGLHQAQRLRPGRVRRRLQAVHDVRGQPLRAAVRRRVDRPLLPHRHVRGRRHRRAAEDLGRVRGSRRQADRSRQEAVRLRAVRAVAGVGVLLVPVAVAGGRRPPQRGREGARVQLRGGQDGRRLLRRARRSTRRRTS